MDKSSIEFSGWLGRSHVFKLRMREIHFPQISYTYFKDPAINGSYFCSNTSEGLQNTPLRQLLLRLKKLGAKFNTKAECCHNSYFNWLILATVL